MRQDYLVNFKLQLEHIVIHEWNLMSCMAAFIWDVLLTYERFLWYMSDSSELQSHNLLKLISYLKNHIFHKNHIALWGLIICHYFHLQYDAAILHTTFARLLGPPKTSAPVIWIYIISGNLLCDIIAHFRLKFGPDLDISMILRYFWSDVDWIMFF